MVRRLFFISILIAVLFSLNCSVLQEAGINALAEKLRLQLKRKEFGEIYDEASKHLHINASKVEFIERASKIVEKMEKVDKELNWQPDDTLGKSTKLDKYEINTYFSAYKKLGVDTQEIIVFIGWEQIPNDKPKLFHLSARSHPNAEHPFYLETAGKIVYSK
jgi:hypothetical protein